MGKLDNLHWKEVEKVIQSLGFYFVRQKGSHRTYKKDGWPRIVTVPQHRKLKRGTLQKGIIANLPISKDEFLELIINKRH